MARGPPPKKMGREDHPRPGADWRPGEPEPKRIRLKLKALTMQAAFWYRRCFSEMQGAAVRGTGEKPLPEVRQVSERLDLMALLASMMNV